MASLPYIQQLSKVIVAQISQTIGWNAIQSIPLELMGDILHKYLQEITRQIHRYTELYGRTEPNLDDVALALRDLNIELSDLEEYISNVDPVPCAISVPKFPVAKESHLNFLKPGSKEVVTRPVHIHEHLPPIHPEKEADAVEQPEKSAFNNSNNNSNGNNGRPLYSMDMNHLLSMSPPSNEEEIINDSPENFQQGTIDAETIDSSPFKKPFDAQIRNIPSGNNNVGQHNLEKSTTSDVVGRPTREIISCFMTTSGFISPAREGKLPEAKRPVIIPDEPPILPPAVVNNSNQLHSNQTDEKPIKKEKNAIEQNVSNNNTIIGVKGNSNNKKLLSENIDKEKSSNKKRKLLQMSKEHKKAKKQMRLMQGKDDIGRQIPMEKSKLNIKSRDASPISNALMQQSIDILNTNHELLPFGHDHVSKDLSMKNTLSPPMKKIKKSQEGKYKIKADAIDPESGEKKKKKTPKLSKKKLEKLAAANAALSMNFTHNAAGNPWFGNNEMNAASKINHLPDMLHGNIPSSLETAIAKPVNHPDANIYKTPDIVAKPEYDSNSNDSSQYYQSHPSASYKNTDKLSTEPDKRKLNIFKKISSSNAANSTDQSGGSSKKSRKNVNGVQNNPNTSVKFADYPQQMPVKLHLPNDDIDAGPLNMSARKTDITPFSSPLVFNASAISPTGKKQKVPKTPRDPNLKKQPKPPKIPKEKKPKKEVSPKKPRQPKALKAKIKQGLQDNADAAAVAAAAAAVGGSSRAPYLFPNILDQFSGPGLIPGNPLFQSVPFGYGPPNTAVPFQPLPGFDILNFPAHFKKPSFGDGNLLPSTNLAGITDLHREPPIKAQCNVAPLVPHTKPNKFSPEPAEVNTVIDISDDISDDDEFGQRYTKDIVSEKPLYESPVLKQKPQDSHYDEYEERKQRLIIPDNVDNEEIEDFPIDLDEPPATPKSFHKSEHHSKKSKDRSGHKKDRKDKTGSGVKSKKKKDKKDKSKSKSDKRALKEALKNKEVKDKSAAKKEKREKKKEKERLALALAAGSKTEEILVSRQVKETTYVQTTSTIYGIEETSLTDTVNTESSGIPKLTLKLGPSTSSSPRPATPDIPSRKTTKKSMKKKKRRSSGNDSDKIISDNEFEDTDYSRIKNTHDQHGYDDRFAHSKRDPSPELVRISALVTHPPKQKQSSRNSSSPSTHTKSSTMEETGLEHTESNESLLQPRSKIILSPAVIPGTHGIKTISQHASPPPPLNVPTTPTTSGRGRPKGVTNKSGKNRQLKLNTAGMNATQPSNIVTTPLSSISQLTIPSSLATSSASAHQDAEGNQVWICPACGAMDDGTPMIGCDGCDDWYHWVCVGIQVAPDQDQDWYCRACISKKQGGDKKKKRKKKDKKDH